MLYGILHQWLNREQGSAFTSKGQASGGAGGSSTRSITLHGAGTEEDKVRMKSNFDDIALFNAER